MDSIIQLIQDTFGISREYSFLVVGIIIGIIFIGFTKSKKIGSTSTRSIDITAGRGLAKNNSLSNIDQLKGSVSIKTQTLDIDHVTMSKIQNLVRAGNKIEAIKLLREVSGLGLAESKNIIDRL